MDCHTPSPRLCRIVIALLALLVWGATATYDFAWDDHYFIMDNTGIRSLKNIPSMFYSTRAEAVHPHDFPNFRPLRNVVYAVLYWLPGKENAQPWIYHSANVLAHAVAALMVFAVASLLFAPAVESQGRWAALLTAAAFAVHPGVSEVVCWAKSLDDILAAIFVLAAVRQILLWHGGRRRIVAALLFYVLAIYSKESAVPFAAVVFILLRAWQRLAWRQCARLTAPFALVAGIYMVHRDLVLGQMAQCPPLSGSYGQTLLDTVPALAIYARLLWGIPPFSIDYMAMRGHLGFLSAAVLGGLLVLVVWAALTCIAWRNERYRTAAMGLLWMGLFFLPVSNLVPMMQYAAERFLYLPMIGWLLALGTVLAWQARSIVRLGMGGLLAVWIPVSLTRETIWHDELTLYIRSNLDSPANKRLRENAVVAVFTLPRVKPYFRLVGPRDDLSPSPTIPRQEAENMLPMLAQVHALLPEEPRFTSALVITYAAAGQASNAVKVLEEVVKRQTNNVQMWNDLGTAYALERNTARAREAWETALRLEPTNKFALEHVRMLKGK